MADNGGVNLGDTELLVLLNQRFGTKAVLMHYMRKAKDAAARAKVDLINQNPHNLGANTQQMIDAIDMMTKLMGDDGKTVEVDLTVKP